MKYLDLNGNEYNIEEAIKIIYKKYSYEFDGLYEIRDISDYLQQMYEEKGSIDSFFMPSATNEYKKDFNSLVRIKE